MQRSSLIVILAFALSACGQDDLQAEITNDADLQAVKAVSTYSPRDFSKDLAQPIGLEIGMDRDSAEAELRTYFGTTTSGGQIPLFKSKTLVDGEYEIIATRNGLQDDSIKSEQALVHFADGILVDYGMRVKCYRSNNPDEWTKELCP